MSAITLKAHFDGQHICLDEPYDFQADAKLMVTVVSESDQTFEVEREAWFALGRQSLARAYGNDEPDYSDCVGKAPPAE